MNISMIKNVRGRRLRYEGTMERRDGRLWFNMPFEVKDELKALKGSRWHGRDDPPIKAWSAKDCARNDFQLAYLAGKNPYSWFERPIQNYEYGRPLRDYQRLMTDHMLTYHYGILAAEMGTGKTISSIEIIEQSGVTDWVWVGPKSAIAAVEREFVKWDLQVMPRLMTYEGLTKMMKTWVPGAPAPQGVVFDESSRLKGPNSQRTQSAMALADAIRKEHGFDGYVVLMSGTPSPKSPLDLWSQCEIAWPGFLREGSPKAFEWRLGLFEKKKKIDGHFFHRVTWLDDERKCAICGQIDGCKGHTFKPSINEVAYLDKRLDGLVLPLLKKDCLDLPEKIYREVNLKPSKTIERVSKGLADIAPTAIQALTWLRELSDGFQYRDVQSGEKPCSCLREGESNPECDVCEGEGVVPVMKREAREIPCPKLAAVKSLLEENEEQRRLVIFAGFTGSIDRIRETCLEAGWEVVQVDGRGWKVFADVDRKVKPLDHWQASESRVVFLAHPQSGGLGLTLTEARMAVFYSNDFNPESRSQAEDRIHRIGMDENLGATIVDLYHLPTDQYVRNVLKANRRLELMTLGEVKEQL